MKEVKQAFEESMKNGWGMHKEEVYYIPRCFLGFHWQQKKVKVLHWLAYDWETLQKGVDERYELNTEKGVLAFDILWKFKDLLKETNKKI